MKLHYRPFKLYKKDIHSETLLYTTLYYASNNGSRAEGLILIVFIRASIFALQLQVIILGIQFHVDILVSNFIIFRIEYLITDIALQLKCQ